MDLNTILGITNWTLLGVMLISAGIAAGWMSYRAWKAMQTTLAASRDLTPLLDGLAQRSTTALQRAEAAGEHLAEIETAALRLEESISRLAVLASAFNEANRRWKRVTGFVK